MATFMEYLLQAGMTAANINNHLTAIRSCGIIYNCDTTPFRDNRIPLFLISVKIYRALQPTIKFVVDENILYNIYSVCHRLPFPKVFGGNFFFPF